MTEIAGTSERAEAAPEPSTARADLPSAAPLQRAPLGHLFAAFAAIIAIWFTAASRWIFTDTVVPWDSKNQFYPFFRFLASALNSGATPFWNPYHYGGHPSVADPQSLIFAPAFVLWALFDLAPSLRTFDMIVYAHLLLGGLAMAGIGWRARWPAVACVLAAVLFMFAGVAAGRLQHTGAILAYSFFPPSLLLLQVALDRRSLVAAAGLAVAASLLALGRNQVALLLCFVLVAVAMAEVVTAKRPLNYLRERLAAVATMAVGGLALVSAPLLLTVQFAALSNRPSETFETAVKSSLHPLHLAQLGVADLFVTKGEYWGPGPWSIPELPYIDDSFSYMFVGSVAVVLLLWFGVVGGRAFQRGRILLVCTMVLALLYALGRYTPAFEFFYDYVPGVAKFRRPIDATFVFVAMLALLAGHLLSDYVREGLPRRRLLASIAVAGAVLAMLAWALVFLGRSSHVGNGLLELLRVAPIPIGVIAVLAWARTPRARVVAAALVTLVAVGELLWWNAAFRLNGERRTVYSVLEAPRPIDTEVLNFIDRLVRERQAAGERPRIEIVGMPGPWQNVAMVRGLEATNGYNPLRIGFYDRLVSPGEGNWLTDLREFPASFDSYDCALARALGLEFVVLGRPIEQVKHLAKLPVADVLQAGPRAWVYRLRDPAPRLKFLPRVQVADADATAGNGQLLVSPSPDRVLIDDDTPLAKNYTALAEGHAGRARIVSWRGDRIEIDADSELGGVLALHETYYPGWVAEIDERPTPVLRADVLFRGVEVPAGHHHVVFRFAPFSPANLMNALKGALHRVHEEP
jgi:hypothetical protein